ncbi:MAG: hypothetical protein IPP74_02520 [Alphaproteobacteria bacterium]|jgi:hypothetical protein|nr:hypothetical protein [Alphaproteobacteria bacterium]
MTTHPAKHNFYVYRGATFSEQIEWKDESGTPVNLTGFTARMHMRETLEAADPFLTLTTENGGITLGGVAGTIQLLASATQTTAITATSGVYDLELVSGANVTRLLEGLVIISPEVTR